MNIEPLKESNYIRPEEKIYDFAINEEDISWKSFLYQLIHEEGLDPWNIDIGILTRKYLETLKNINKVDFNLSGKFLTIAIFLLKTKAETLVEKDLRGLDEEISKIKEGENISEEIDDLEMLDEQINNIEQNKNKENYELKIRNPFERKKKVSIFELIDILEVTIEQSNKRRANFLQRKSAKYNGPIYEHKKKDLKEIIEEIYEFIINEIENKKGHITFSHLTKGVKHKRGILEKFLPILHLHNQNRIELRQKEHFSDIEIHKINKEESLN